MMLGRMSRKARPVVREKSGEDAPLWRIFDPGFKGKVEVLLVRMVRKGSTSPFVTISSCLHGRQWRQSCRKAKVVVQLRLDTGSKPTDEKKRKVDDARAGEQKRPKLRKTWTTAISQPKPAVVTGKLTICLQVFVFLACNLWLFFALL
ncbi:hypothetical protein Hdeb2414_s0017g00513021 [Helianthus debilis subsp. tardiflorus]